jgi:hypothetical protein
MGRVRVRRVIYNFVRSTSHSGKKARKLNEPKRDSLIVAVVAAIGGTVPPSAPPATEAAAACCAFFLSSAALALALNASIVTSPNGAWPFAFPPFAAIIM